MQVLSKSTEFEVIQNGSADPYVNNPVIFDGYYANGGYDDERSNKATK